MIIEWTEPALYDLESIRDYIKRDSEIYANQFIERILNTVESLCDFPAIGRKLPEINDDTIREIVFNNYRIIYHLDKTRLLILAVIHGARDLSNIKPNPWEII